MEKFFNIPGKIKYDSPPFERDFYGIVKSSFFHFPSWKNGRTKREYFVSSFKRKIKRKKEKRKKRPFNAATHMIQSFTYFSVVTFDALKSFII